MADPELAPNADAAGRTRPTISIAMATYNGERFLREQLDSLARQTLLPLELVVGDDASMDATASIIEDFAERVPFPVRLQKNSNRLGFRGNFFAAAERCQGDLIAFCDQDDVWHETKLAKCVVPFQDPNVTMVCHDAEVVDEAGRRLGRRLVPRPNGQWTSFRKPLHLEYGMSMVFRRSLNDHDDLWPRTAHVTETGQIERETHDQWYYFLAAIFGDIVNIDECLVDYRQHGSNVIGAFTRKVDRTAEYRSRYFQVRVDRLRHLIKMWPELRQRATPVYRERMDQHLPAYQAALRMYEGRTVIYSNRGLSTRIGGMITMAKAAGYSRNEFGLRGMAPDIVFGMLRLTPGPRTAQLYRKINGLVR